MHCKIYKIVNSKNNKVYFGSTTKTLVSRLGKHRSDSKKTDNYFYRFTREVGFEFFRIILIEQVKVESKSDLLKIEDKYISEFKKKNPDLCLNTNRSYTSSENKKIRKHEQYLKDKEGQYSRRRKLIMKSTESHDKYKEECKSYYQENKEKWKKNNGVKIKCECQREVSKANFKRHLKSPMHARFLDRYHLSLLPQSTGF